MESWAHKALAPITPRTTEVAGETIHYLDEGEGPPILCLHPAPAWSIFYKRLILEMRGKYRLIAPDFPGFGLSCDPAEFSLESLRRFVLQFMDQLELDQVTLLVNDASGSIGIGAATDAPHRFSRLIITDTFAFPLTGRLFLVQLILRYMMLVVRYPNRWFNLIPWAVTTAGCFWNLLSQRERKEYLMPFRSWKRRDRVVTWFRQLGLNREYFRLLQDQIRKQLSEHPCLIIYGQLDPMRILGAHNRFARLLPNNQVHLIPWEEHFPILGSTKRVAQVIDQWFEEQREPETTPTDPQRCLIH